MSSFEYQTDASAELIASDESVASTHEVAVVETAENGFLPLNLNRALLKAVEELGYTEPTPVQAQTIPAALNGGDWMVSSQTGSGKTAAFLLPAIHALLAAPPMSKGEEFARKRRAAASPRVLVLAPTRELAQQVAQEAIRLVRFCKGVRIANVVGGTAFGKQLMDLRGASLVVATPGRLLDLHRNGQVDLDAVQTLVVDEADRMLDLGFSEDLEAIHVATGKRERTMMFSATFAPRIMSLAANVMRDPQRIELATAQDTHENIDQRLHWFDNIEHKNKLLEHYLGDETMEQAIVFAATQVETDELAEELRDAGYSAAALHGAMPQAMRNRRISSLRDGKLKILVATDVAARGIDVPTISHVINYGLPMKPEDYVHRIGRTGRAGRNGFAVTLAGARDRYRIRNIEHFTQQRIEAGVVEGLEPQTNPSQGFARGRGPRFGNRDGGFGERAPRFGNRDGGFGGREGGFGHRERSNDRFADRGNHSAERAPREAFAQREDAAPREFNAPGREFAPRQMHEDRAPASPYARDAGQNRAPRNEWRRDEAPRFSANRESGQREFAPRRESSWGQPRTDFRGDSRGYQQREAAPRGYEQQRSFAKPAQGEFASHAAHEQYAPRAPRAAREDHAEKTFAHQSRTERRGDKPAGPAYTAPAAGGNRAARRAHLAAQYAAAQQQGE